MQRPTNALLAFAITIVSPACALLALRSATSMHSLRQMMAASLSVLLVFSILPAQATVTTGSMTVARMMHRTSALPDGRILITGGVARPSTAAYASTEIYDPASGLFAAAAPMLLARTEHASVTLNDGRILVIGGTIATSPSVTGTNSAEIYDPASGQWNLTGNMNIARSRVLARLLPDGRVFVMNADGYSGTPYAEIYDPQSGTFSMTGNMVEVSGWHGLVVLADGRVLKVGGLASQGYSSHAEIWDPASNQWSATGSMSVPRQTIRPVLLPDGKVLVAGGRNSSFLNTAEIYDPATGQFSAGGSMPAYLSPTSATILANGNVIFMEDNSKTLLQYQVDTGQWNLTGPKRSVARETSISILPNGNLLLAGGAAENDATAYAAVWDQACAPQQISLAGNTKNIGPDGGQVSFSVNAAPGCRFEVADLPVWVGVVTTDPLVMPASGSMTISLSVGVNATGANRTASFSLGNNAASIVQSTPPPLCPAAPGLSPSSFNFAAGASSGTIQVTAAATCPWNFSSLPGWVTAGSSISGTGNGSLSYTVAANTGTARSASGQITGPGYTKTFVMNQAAAPLCPTAPTLSATFFNFPASASSGTIQVTAAATCPWTFSLPSWVTAATSVNGTGSGNFSYNVAANTGAARSASGQVTGPGYAQSFNMNQAASPCASWTISPASVTIPAGGATGSFTVTAPSACNWNLGALPSWVNLIIGSSTSGSGNGTVNYSVAANTGTARSASALLSGSGPTLSVGLSQAGAGSASCSTAINSGTPISGNLKAIGCPAGARGTSYYTDRYTFTSTPGRAVTIFLSSTAFDTYLYLRDPSGTVIRSDDDGGGGTNSRIPAASGSYTLPAGTGGTYTIEVTSYGAYYTGAYTVSFTQ